LNSIYLDAYFNKMDDTAKLNYRMLIFKELNKRLKKQMNKLAIRLIIHEGNSIITVNEKNVFKDQIMKSIKDLVLK